MSLLVAACADGPEDVDFGDGGPVAADYRILAGWTRDNQAEVIPALLRTCGWLQGYGPEHRLGPGGKGGKVADWRPICAAAKQVPPGNRGAARQFFERWFTPVPLGDRSSGEGGAEGLFTGYYECQLHGSWTRTGAYTVPLYKTPSRAGHPLPSRAEIVRGALAGRGLELMWVDDPVEAFILEIQGSGRARMTDGTEIGINYDGQNGQKYYAIGRYLVEQGVSTYDQMSLKVIRDWLHAHPDQAQRVMNLNPSYVFFKTRPVGDPQGATAKLTARRSMAVDPSYVPLGVPLWLDLHNVPIAGGTLRTLVMAQDTGGAIKGAVRGDFFWGHGEEAADAASVMKARGHYAMLVPRKANQRAEAEAP